MSDIESLASLLWTRKEAVDDAESVYMECLMTNVGDNDHQVC